ncbi:tripartite motif-containing protein 2-like [Branchiostoma lanceolatum]|uniref:tripartite motif-containing protein 2-like n=1 Tax=Branchiostoma lanceolatum TaxID=7740 RepID=UPI003453ADBE
MASNVVSEITEELLVCQICLEDFKQPKVLPCLHTFCQPCLEKLLATEPVGKLDCPTCRQDVPLPQNGVQGLKSNFIVGKLHDILQQQTKGKAGTSEAKEDDAPCTVCERGNSAESYCVECADYLCQMCNDTHRRLKVSGSHKVVTVQDLQSGHQSIADIFARETSMCEDHHELNKFYCDTCHRVICLHCVVTAHSDHQYVEIEKAAERERTLIRGRLSTAHNTGELHEKWIQQLRSLKDKWSSRVQRTEEEIEEQAETIIEAVNKAKNDRIGQLRAMNAAREKQLKMAIEAAEMDLASAKSCIQFTDTVLEYGSPAEVMLVVEEVTERLKQTSDENIAEKVELTKDLRNLTFYRPSLPTLEKEVFELMGTITPMRVRKLHELLPVRPYPPMSPRGESLKLLKTVGKKGKEDGQFVVPTSVAVTVEGDIVVTDHGNKRLQFLDNDGNFKKKIDLGFSPKSVAAMTNGELLVTGDGHRIHVLDKDGMLSRVIQVAGAEEKDEDTTGIAVDGWGRIIVTIRHQVFVLNSRGDPLFTFRDKGSFFHVTVNSSHQIIVSDGKNILKVFDLTGSHLVTVKTPNYPCGIITDSEDNIVVADRHNHRVSLFSREGTFIRDVLTRKEHGLNTPIGLTLTDDGRLVVCGEHYVKIFVDIVE